MLAGRSGGVAAIVRDGKTGVLTPPGDSAALGEALRALLDAPEARRAMGRAAMDTVAQEHTLEAAGRRLDQILRETAGP